MPTALQQHKNPESSTTCSVRFMYGLSGLHVVLLAQPDQGVLGRGYYLVDNRGASESRMGASLKHRYILGRSARSAAANYDQISFLHALVRLVGHPSPDRLF